MGVARNALNPRPSHTMSSDDASPLHAMPMDTAFMTPPPPRKRAKRPLSPMTPLKPLEYAEYVPPSTDEFVPRPSPDECGPLLDHAWNAVDTYVSVLGRLSRGASLPSLRDEIPSLLMPPWDFQLTTSRRFVPPEVATDPEVRFLAWMYVEALVRHMSATKLHGIIYSSKKYGPSESDTAAMNWAYTRALVCVSMAVKVVTGQAISLYLLQTLLGVYTAGTRKALIILECDILNATQGHLLGPHFAHAAPVVDDMSCD